MTATLIIGCGDLGRRIAKKLRAQNHNVTGLVRTSSSAKTLQDGGIDAMQVDLDNTDQSIDIADKDVFYLLAPHTAGQQDTRMQRFLELASGTPHRLIYLSTTGVYGDCHGAWIDETTPVAPNVDRARRRVDAESQVRKAAMAGDWPFVIVRVPGIYGPGRLPLQRLQDQQPLLRADQAPFTNRIHVDDLATIFVAMRTQGRSGEIYNATDGHPGNMTEYFNRVADFAGLPHPPVIDMNDARNQLSKGLLSYLGESRRLRNTKLMSELDLELQYPTLDDGLAAIFAANPGESAQ